MIVYKKAENESDLDEIYRLRFRVYCRERGYEPEYSCLSGRERDEFDQYSIHFIARHYNLTPVGTIRLTRNIPLGLPADKSSKKNIPRREVVAEVSKLAISRIAIKMSGSNRREVVLGLFKSLYQESKALGIQYWCAGMNESLCRLLNRYGIRFVRMGETAEHYGPCALYMAELRKIEKDMSLINPALFKYFTGSQEEKRFGYLSFGMYRIKRGKFSA
ncbi:MAG: exosortase system-associated [Geobacteraceae bacterium]|nr:MAG: exosortase system-associated [Geobacteraceae bacterium]